MIIVYISCRDRLNIVIWKGREFFYFIWVVYLIFTQFSFRKTLLVWTIHLVRPNIPDTSPYSYPSSQSPGVFTNLSLTPGEVKTSLFSCATSKYLVKYLRMKYGLPFLVTTTWLSRYTANISIGNMSVPRLSFCTIKCQYTLQRRAAPVYFVPSQYRCRVVDHVERIPCWNQRKTHHIRYSCVYSELRTVPYIKQYLNSQITTDINRV